jgi:hypothetical protein
VRHCCPATWFVLAGVLAALAGCPGEVQPASPPCPPAHRGFPLAEGAEWQYDVVLNYAERGHDDAIRHWRGTVTRRVTRAEQQGDTWIFWMETTRYPGPGSHGAQHKYVLHRGALYELSSDDDHDTLVATGGVDFEHERILAPPGQPPEPWSLLAQGAMTTAAGHFTDCESWILRTLPDHTAVAYCSGVGPVRREYAHHGTRHDERWTLRDLQPPRCHRAARRHAF